MKLLGNSSIGCIIALVLALSLAEVPGSGPGNSKSREQTPAQSSEDRAGTRSLVGSYTKLPLNFEPNHGQINSRVNFLSRGSGYSLFLTSTEAVLVLPRAESIQNTKDEQAVLRMQLIGSNPEPHVIGLDELSGRSNYLTGNDPRKWHTDVPTYARVKYQDVYPGVDLIFYGNQRRLEYDFIVSPGADSEGITVSFSGADGLEVNAQGDLVLRIGDAQIHQQKPTVYQEADGTRQAIAGGYVLKGNQVGFQLASFDATRPLVIDPVFSTYWGGTGIDRGLGIAVDSSGNAYVTGYTLSTNFPTVNALKEAPAPDNTDAFVVKLDAAGSALVYSTYLGGRGLDEGHSIAADAAGHAYVTGSTVGSEDFPTVNAFQEVPASGDFDAFVAKLSPTGSALVYSTFLGGSGSERWRFGSIAVDNAGNAYVKVKTASGQATLPKGPDGFILQDQLYFAQVGNGQGFTSDIVC